MAQHAPLWLFFLMVFGIIALPGMDMAFVLSNALVGGRRSGLYAVAGMVAGGVFHTVAGVLGVGVLLQRVPGLTQMLMTAGAAYIAWIGYSLLRSNAVLGALPEAGSHASVVFYQAVLTCLMNPKAYLFMLAVFPQFLRPGGGMLWVQAAVLGGIIALTQMAVYGMVALAAGRSRRWLAARPLAQRQMARGVGLLLMAGALLTLLQGWING